MARTFAGMRRITALMFAILETAAMQKLTFIAQVLVSEYADHPPLYRQPRSNARQGVNLVAAALTRRGRAHHML